jgi:hypothetical protein
LGYLPDDYLSHIKDIVASAKKCYIFKGLEVLVP